MKLWSTILLRGLAVFVPLALGGLAVNYSASLKASAGVKETVQQPTHVRVITLAPVDLLPRITGYGPVAPANEWRAVARVEGEIVETSPLLANGQVAGAGTVLLRIDDTDLRLSLAQLEAQFAALDVRNQTLNASLDISRADLEINEVELQRQRDLRARGVTTQTALDLAARQELAARARLTEIENQLALNEAERKVLDTQRASAARGLEFIEVVAPFNVRIGKVQAGLGQFVTRGATLFTADGTDAAEISAQFRLGQLGPLVRGLDPGATVLDLAATVRLSQAGHAVEWQAEVDRVGDTVDARTQSMSIVVRVEQPQAKAVPGSRPPLRRDMYLEVELSAPPGKALVAPTSALQGGSALVVSSDGKLEKRLVEVVFSVNGISAIGSGLVAGDRLVVTDPAVAIPGMSVRPVEDEVLVAEIARIAAGQGPGK